MASKPKTKDETLVSEMDEFAHKMVKAAMTDMALPEPTMGVGARMDVFKEVARWVSIKHRLEGAGETEGNQLSDIKARLHSDDVIGTPHRPRPLFGVAAKPERLKGNGGSALEAIKSRIPRDDGGDLDGDDDSDSPAAGG